jgi:hypothetical protein
MITKNKIYTPVQMNRDEVFSAQKEGNYYYGENIRLNTSDNISSGGFSFEKGNKIIASIQEIKVNHALTSIEYKDANGNVKYLKYTAKNQNAPRCEIEASYSSGQTSGKQEIIGGEILTSGLLLVSTDGAGFDCFWVISDYDNFDGKRDINLIYCRNLGLSKENPVQVVSNYENENIEKIYFIDGQHQQRSFNVRDVDLIDNDSNTIEMVGDFNCSSPVITGSIPGGSHTAGMIQYCYNLYNLSGSQTKTSPVTDLYPLDKDSFGEDLNNTVGKTVNILIDKIDVSYSNIKIYAVKYNTLNQEPRISIIFDGTVPASRRLSVKDDGSVLSDITGVELKFLGGDIIVPRHMAVKKNRLFFSDYVEKTYDIEEDVHKGNFRAFSADSLGQCSISETMNYVNNSVVPGESQMVFDINSIPLIPPKHSCINTDYKKYKFNKQGKNGGSGLFLNYEIKRVSLGNPEMPAGKNLEKGKFLKDGEYYRLAIVLVSTKGEDSTPKWIGDFIVERTANLSNLNGNYATLEVTFNSEFYSWINSLDAEEKPIGYKIVRADRTVLDRTIIAQGIINGSVVCYNHNKNTTQAQESERILDTAKLPSLIRTFGDSFSPMMGNRDLLSLNTKHPLGEPNSLNGRIYYHRTRELMRADASDDWRKKGVQFNKLMTFNSAEIEKEFIGSVDESNFSAIGVLDNETTASWGQEINKDSLNTVAEVKVNKGLTWATSGVDVSENQSGSFVWDFGMFGTTNSGDTQQRSIYYRSYRGFEFKEMNYKTLGTPEVAERGQELTLYNNTKELGYMNNMRLMSTDDTSESDIFNDNAEPLQETIGLGCRSAFFAIKKTEDDESLNSLKTIEEIYFDLNIDKPKGLVVGEFRKNYSEVYFGKLYNGNSYEEKKRTQYIEIGGYKEITGVSGQDKLHVIHAGDTFVGVYNFARISSDGSKNFTANKTYITEIVSFMTESTVDMHRTGEDSKKRWDANFNLIYENYSKYNEVYSQQNILNKVTDNDYNFRKVSRFETSIIASKEKIDNELVDSWTDIQQAEIETLEGKHGRINGLVVNNDTMYAFQDRAVALVSILPRVQVTGDDDLQVQLGTGTLFNGYEYLTTNSGSSNKWGVLSSQEAIYYVDILNRSLMAVAGKEVIDLGLLKGRKNDILEYVDTRFMRRDNPLIHQGVSCGFDNTNSDIFFTFFKEDGSKKTICYNEKNKGFSSDYSYHSPIYIYNKKEMVSTSPKDNSSLFLFHAGEYNIFYGERKESMYHLILAPEILSDSIFNAITYYFSAIDKNGKEVNISWENIRLYNHFQDTGMVKIILDRSLRNNNSRKLNRQFRVEIPRVEGGRERIRNNYSILELSSLNQGGNNCNMYPIVLSYNSNYIAID